MSSQKISVTLNSPSDWDEWIEVIKTQALVGKVWDYVDPSKDQVPALEEPLPPQPKDVNDQASTFGQLTQEEREEYRILRQDYKWQRDLYDKRDNALSSLRTSIQSSVSRSCLHYTFGTSSAREMLIELQKRLQPTDQLRELNLSTEYQKLKIAPESYDLDNWLRNWEKTYHKCTKINLPDVQGTRAVRDFLRAVSTIIPEFSTYWVNDMAKAGCQDGPDLYRMVELFRDHQRHLAIEKGHVSQLAFTTTFQDQDQDQDQQPQERDRDCLCGEPHRFKDCPYLIKEKRPPDWTPEQDIQERIKEKLQNPRLKAAVKYARASQAKKPQEVEEETSETDTESIAETSFAFTAVTTSHDIY
jgi:hypothetical protein